MVNIELPPEHSDSETQVISEPRFHQRKYRNDLILYSHLANLCLQELDSPVDEKSRASAAAAQWK